MTMLKITCRDPIVARDGRPFGANQGNRMRSLDWVLPSVLAGSLRSALGKSANRDFSVATAEDLLDVEIAGPVPLADGQLYFPAPQDCVFHPQSGPLRAAPWRLDEGGCDWPAIGLQPVSLTQEQAPDDFKPAEPPAWWPADRYAAWLAGDHIKFDERFLDAAEIEHRTHVSLAAETGAADEGELFTTAALVVTHLRRHAAGAEQVRSSRFAEIALAARVRADGWCGEALAGLDTLHSLGGERRLAHWTTVAEGAWSCPEIIRAALAKASRVRMVLVTPAMFRDGWKPGWLNDALAGIPPGARVNLRLVGVSIQRWRAVSGWSLLNNPPNQRPGPKPVKRIVPAGGTYFFEIAEGESSDLAGHWLEPVSDDEQNRRDGFGLAAWGIW